jgi:hypothetical protein
MLKGLNDFLTARIFFIWLDCDIRKVELSFFESKSVEKL